MNKDILINKEQNLINELSNLIEQSRNKISLQANSTLTLLFWQLGKYINDFVLHDQRADYGKQIVSIVSTQLTDKYGIMVAEYWTDLPPKNILEQKLHQAVIEAKERLQRRKLK